jgi:hypothetical protein
MPKTYFFDTGTLCKLFWFVKNRRGGDTTAIHRWRKIGTLLLQSIMINYDKPKQYFLTAVDGCARIPKRLKKKS